MKTATKKTTPQLSAENGIFTIELNLNGKKAVWRVEAGDTLLDALRKNGWRGTKRGCDTGDCGSCTVLVDGKAVLACLLLAVAAHDRKVESIESLGTTANPHPLQTAFVESGAVQCGFCIPGMLMAAKNLLDAVPEPDETQIRRALDGNLCRCTGYVKQVEAVSLAAKRMKAGGK